jgi:hypothetical protein
LNGHVDVDREQQGHVRRPRGSGNGARDRHPCGAFAPGDRRALGTDFDSNRLGIRHEANGRAIIAHESLLDVVGERVDGEAPAFRPDQTDIDELCVSMQHLVALHAKPRGFAASGRILARRRCMARDGRGENARNA